jgi:Druantia protein DruA
MNTKVGCKHGEMNRSTNHRSDGTDLRNRIVQSLRSQGFRVRSGAILPPTDLSKQRVRELHETAVQHRIEGARDGLFRKEKDLLRRVANGIEVIPSRICPRLVEVVPESEDELLFRYASLHWSIPVSSGYGRRLRFLVTDDQNGKLIGLIGLGDPVYSLGPRDEWVGWTLADRKRRLRNVMDAFVLGAVPPYSFLLCGKLVAILAACDTIRDAFKRKYGGTRSLIKRKEHDGRLALITTTSALGRSSVYNRLRLGSRLLYQSVGFTRGSGDFHFSNGLYGALTEFAEANCEPTAKQERWGTGFRNRREVIRKCLLALGLSRHWAYHGIEREVFVVPLARNAREFLKGQHTRLLWYQESQAQMFDHFRERWMLPRASWDKRFELWRNDQWAIWLQKESRHG